MQIDYIEKLKTYHDFLSSLKRAFSSLNHVKVLEQKNINYIYAIDFSEIFEYCIPFSKGLDKTWFELEIESKTLLKDQITLWSIFNHFGQLILLPPHKIELYRQIEKIRNDVRLKQYTIKSEIEKIRNDLLNNTETKNIEKVLAKWQDKNELDQNDRNDILNFVQEHFSKLKAFETVTSTLGLNKIKELIDSKKVVSVKFKFRDFFIEERVFQRKTRPWYEEFFRRRPIYRKELANYLDAQACVYLTELNSRLIKDKQIILFLSRSSIMLDILDTFYSVKINDQNISVTNNLDSIMLQNINKIEDESSKRSIMNNIKKDYQNLMRSYEAIDLGKKDIFNRSKACQVIKEIDNIFDLFDSRENIDLFLSEKQLTSFWRDSDHYEHERISSLVDLLISFLTSNKDFGREIEERINSLSGDLRKLSTDLIADLKDLRDLEYLKKITKFERKRGRAIVLEGISGEMPTLISFHSEEVAKIAREIFEDASEVTGVLSKKTLQHYREKIKSIGGTTLSAEFAILLSYLEACAGHWGAAFKVLSESADPEYTNIEIEFRYFKSFICRKTENTLFGLQECKKGLDLKPNDSRILREFSVLLWQCYNENKLREQANKLLNIKASRSFAVEQATLALKNTDDIRLKARCLNSLAYFFAESGEEEDLAKAEDYYNSIEKLYGDKIDFPARFYDTKAYILYKQSLIMGIPIENKKIKLKNALHWLDKALTLGGLIGKELEIVSQHRFAILMELQTD